MAVGGKIILNNINIEDQFEAVAASNDLKDHKSMIAKQNNKYFYVKRNKSSVTVSYVMKSDKDKE